MEFKTTELERHQLLNGLLDGNYKRTRAHLQRVKNTLEICKTEETLPELALKGYCYLADKKKIRELIPKVPKINSRNIRNYLFSTLESGDPEVLSILLKDVDKLPNELFRACITKSCLLGHNRQLDVLLNNAHEDNLDEATCRFGGINALLEEKPNAFATICRHSKSEWLEGWKSHLSKEKEQGEAKNKDLYNHGLQILKAEMTKRSVLKTLKEHNTIEI